jgi:tetratricopeptide (TPR) repeat protein
LALCLALSACTTKPVLAPAWPGDAPEQIELSNTPFFPQDRYQCGPAALATLLSASGYPSTPDQLQPEVFLPERTGSLQPELVAAARKRGFVVYPIRPELRDLIAQLHAGYPVLILQNQGLRSLPVWHYAVVIGANADTGALVSRSGTRPRQLESASRFQRRWALADNWGIVALKPGQLPHHPDWNRYLAAVADLEAAGELDAAAVAYRAALMSDPGLAGAQFGLANVYYASGNLDEAVRLYRSASTDPQLGLWALNNLSNLWLDQGCLDLAEAAIKQAQEGPEGTVEALISTRTRLQRLRINPEKQAVSLCESPMQNPLPPANFTVDGT